MAFESFSEHCTLPRELSWESHQHSDFDRRNETMWPSTERAGRVLTRNYGGRVVVCLPLALFPTLERSTPVFTDISKTDTRWSTDDIRMLFDGVQRHLQPQYGPAGFHYGVQHATVQTFSNTPERFLEDLELIEMYASRAGASPAPRIESSQTPNAAVGAGIWPTDLGWFYLEATQQTTNAAFRVQYGLLRRGPLLDPTDVKAFFNAISDERPRTQGQWPLRQLMVSGQRGTPLTKTEQVDDEFCSLVSDESSETTDESNRGRPSLPLHGTNPLFGTEVSTITDRDLPQGLKHKVYDPLRTVSTLTYDPTATAADEAQYDVGRLIAMEPPITNSVFVTATLNQSR